MKYGAALLYMQSLRRFGIKLGNERFGALLSRLGDPHERYFVAHIAGTKGKGSTTAMIASVLSAHGFRTGGYFSPYVYDVRERVQLNSEMISRNDFARVVGEILPHVEALKFTNLGQTTEFELKTAVGFRYFAEKRADYAAIEVGIGGRLDATNVVSPDVCIITNIGLDHTHILGDTHSKIAVEKAGIIKDSIPCITAATDPSALDVIKRTAARHHSRLWRVVPETHHRLAPNEISYSVGGETLTVGTQRAQYARLILGMHGAYQRINAACAIGAVECLAERTGFAVCSEAIRLGLASVSLPGRLSIIRRNPLVVLDGAHNEMAAQALSCEVAGMPHRRLFLVVGVTGGHDPADVMGPLIPMADVIYATQPTWHKAVPASIVAEKAAGFHGKLYTMPNPLEAVLAAIESADSEDLVLVTGSFYLVGDIKPELVQDEIQPG